MKLPLIILIALAIGFVLGRQVYGTKPYDAGFTTCMEQF